MGPRSWCRSAREEFAALLLGTLVAFSSLAPAQERVSALAVAPADLPPSETIQKTVDEVVMFFNVLDHRGKAVEGIEAPEFEVADRGAVMPISFFQSRTDAPLDVTVAIDLSGSVSRWVKFEVKVANTFLSKTLRPGDSAEIAGFGAEVFVQKDLAKAGERLLAMVKKNPPMDTALYDALRYLAESGRRDDALGRRRKILVLLTDGVDTASRTTAEEARRAVARSGTMVFVVYTGSDQPDPFLKTLTRESGGRIFSGGAAGDPSHALAKIARMLRAQYVIAFHPPELERDGSFHPVEIRSRRKGTRVFSRNGYYAVPRPPVR